MTREKHMPSVQLLNFPELKCFGHILTLIKHRFFGLVVRSRSIIGGEVPRPFFSLYCLKARLE